MVISKLVFGSIFRGLQSQFMKPEDSLLMLRILELIGRSWSIMRFFGKLRSSHRPLFSAACSRSRCLSIGPRAHADALLRLQRTQQSTLTSHSPVQRETNATPTNTHRANRFATQRTQGLLGPTLRICLPLTGAQTPKIGKRGFQSQKPLFPQTRVFQVKKSPFSL